MKASCHLRRKEFNTDVSASLDPALSISPRVEEELGGGRGRLSRPMSCSVETLSFTFARRPAKDATRITSKSFHHPAHQTTLLSRFLVISCYWYLQEEALIISWEAFKVVSHTS